MPGIAQPTGQDTQKNRAISALFRITKGLEKWAFKRSCEANSGPWKSRLAQAGD